MTTQLSLKYRIALVIFFLEALMMTAVLWQTLSSSLESTRAKPYDIFSSRNAIGLVSAAIGIRPNIEYIDDG